MKCFEQELAGKHVLIECDNTTAIAFVRDMGGMHGLRNQIALDIWTWAINNETWLSITHIPGIQNIEADAASRDLYNPRTEWSLQQSIFDQIMLEFGPVEIDLFASNLNNKLPRYVSWHRDPYSEHVDAFTLDWTDLNAYIFPPFSLFIRIVQKLHQTPPKHCVIVYPDWQTQPWHPALLKFFKRTMDLPKNSVFQPIKGKNQESTRPPKHVRWKAGWF